MASKKPGLEEERVLGWRKRHPFGLCIFPFDYIFLVFSKVLLFGDAMKLFKLIFSTQFVSFFANDGYDGDVINWESLGDIMMMMIYIL